MEEKAKIENLTSNIKKYAEERIKLMIIQLHEKSSLLLSNVASVLMIGIVSVFALLFLSIALAYWIGKSLEEPFLGFLIVGGFYLLIGLLIGIYRDKLIQVPIINAFLKTMYNDEN